MSGRGFLKSRLAQLSSEEPPKPHEHPKPAEPLKLGALPHFTEIPKVHVDAVSSQTLVNGNHQVARGRRVIIIVLLV